MLWPDITVVSINPYITNLSTSDCTVQLSHDKMTKHAVVKVCRKCTDQNPLQQLSYTMTGKSQKHNGQGGIQSPRCNLFSIMQDYSFEVHKYFNSEWSMSCSLTSSSFSTQFKPQFV